jgi:hypothetical protein
MGEINPGTSVTRRVALFLLAGWICVGAVVWGAAWQKAKDRGSIRFRNVAGSSGIDFVLENSPTERKNLVETMAGGVAAFDYDGDGLTDIYFTNGAALPSLEKTSPKYYNRLYRNLGGFRFKDVTESAGLSGIGYSMGAAAADYDNDGHVDLFVAGVKRNTLYRNRGNGTFEDVTAKAGIKNEVWSVGGVWFDYDNDGLLDLFVVNYVNWSPDFDRFCGNASGLRVYCHPRFFEGLPNRLYHNEGNGTFKDVSKESGVAAHIGKGMAAAIADYDQDGRTDIYVTNDRMPNFLFHNLGNGRFEEVAFDAGAALLDSGSEISGMGVDFRDYNNDGLPDIVVTALAGETFPLFQNRGHGQFADSGQTSALAVLSRKYSGWGIGLVDFDNDGWKDLFTANAHVDDRVEAFEATTYKQHNSIFRNPGNGSFEDVSEDAGADFLIARAHRGAAFADFDQDGRMDVVVTVLGEGPELWRNVSPNENTWLTLRLEGRRSNRNGIGAAIRVDDQFDEMTSAVSYASSSHYGIHFGTGTRKQLNRIEIRWPSGLKQELRNVRTNQAIVVREGS